MRNVIITGGARGIGRCITEQDCYLIADGYNLKELLTAQVQK